MFQVPRIVFLHIFTASFASSVCVCVLVMLFGYICLRGESALTNHTLLRRTETDVNKEVSSHGVVNPSSSVRSLHSSIHKWFFKLQLASGVFFFFFRFFSDFLL